MPVPSETGYVFYSIDFPSYQVCWSPSSALEADHAWMKLKAATGGEGEVMCKMVFALHLHLSLGTKFRPQREAEESLAQGAVSIPGLCRQSPGDLRSFP
jgi:hypothetical protein